MRAARGRHGAQAARGGTSTGERLGTDPLWRKAPTAMLRYRGLFAALAVGALLLAAAAAAYPMFVSSTASNLVNAGIARGSVTRYGAGMLYQSVQISFGWRVATPSGRETAYERIGEVFSRAAGASPYLAPPVSSILAPEITVTPADRPQQARTGRLFASTDVLEHVRVLSGRDGPGVWLPDLVARGLGVGPGDGLELSVSSGAHVEVPVDGVYGDLYPRALPGYWLPWDTQILPRSPDEPPPPQPILADRDQLIALSKALGIGSATFAWQAPLAAGRELTLDQARDQAAFAVRFATRISSGSTRLGRLFNCCYDYGFRYTRFASYLPDVVRDVDRRLAVIEGPGRLVQTAGVVVALVVIAAAGAFALSTRRTEAGLLFARGVGPLSVAARTALESVLPCLAGGVGGFGLTLLLLRLVGPAGPVAGNAFGAALVGAAVAVGVSIALLGAVAAVRYLHESEHQRARLALLAAVPWEAALLLLAYLAWRRLSGGGSLLEDRALGIQRPSLLLVVFPLLLLGGAGLLGARLFQAAARWIRGRSDRYPAPAYLAVHRVAGGPRLALALVAGSALALGIFVQSQAMVRSLRWTVDAKAGVYVGSDVEARIDYGNVVPHRFPFPMTRVVRFLSAGTLSTGGVFDLLAVDPATLVDAAYWRQGFSSVPLAEIARRLGSGPGAGLPVVLAGQAPSGVASIEVDQKVMPVRVVATATAFPGMTSLRPLVVVDERSFLHAFDGYFNPLDSVQASTELWIRGNEGAIGRALPVLGFRPNLVLAASEVKDIPYVTAVIDTFVVLNVLGLAAAVLVIAGMLMYLQARERSQVVSYGLSLRMGMTHAGHRRALVVELGAMLGSSYLVGAALAVGTALLVVPMLDPLRVIPPGPRFVPPTVVIGMAAAGIAAAAWMGGWLTNLRARRIDLGEVMRLAE